MALQKTFALSSGYSAEYISFDAIDQFSRSEKKALIYFNLWKDKATADAAKLDRSIKPADSPIRLYLTGDRFDAYFINVIAGSEDFVNQCYVAAKAETVDMAHGSGLWLADAVDV